MSPERREETVAFMKRALELAGRSRPSPNPRVGAVVVAGSKIIGEGFHERAGSPHAEVIALREAGAAARGADLYVTLEPCCHVGKTGPCTDAILGSGVARVVVGMVDPDRRVSGMGIRRLEDAGIEVEVGVCFEECADLLFGYSTHRCLGRPAVILKAAATLDGKLATSSGDSRWISCEASRARAHAMRAHADAVLIGVGTVLADDPLLTVRHVDGPDPIRVVMDSSLRIPLESRLVTSAATAPLVIAHTSTDPNKIAALESIDGVTTLNCSAGEEGRVDPEDMLSRLGGMGILEILVEGGATVLGAFVAAGLADRFALFLAPKLLGSGLSWLQFSGVGDIASATRTQIDRVTRIDEDILLEGSFHTFPSAS